MEQHRVAVMMVVGAILLSVVAHSSARPYPWALAGPQDAATQRITACTFGLIGCIGACQLQNCATGSCDSGSCQCDRCEEQQTKTEQSSDVCTSYSDCYYSCWMAGCYSASCDSVYGCQCSNCGASAQSLSCTLGDISCTGVCLLQNCNSGSCNSNDKCQCSDCSNGSPWSFSQDKNAKLSYLPYNYYGDYKSQAKEQRVPAGSYQGSSANRQEANPGIHVYWGRRSAPVKNGGLRGAKAAAKSGVARAPSED